MTTNRIKHTLSLSVAAVAVFFAALVSAQESAGVLILQQPINQDTYAAHREVTVKSTIDGDFVAAGMRVTVDGDVTGDVMVAAQNVEIQSRVGDDIRAAGQHVRVASPVIGHVVAAGQTVTIEQDVGDWAWLAGDSVNVLGNVGGDLSVRATRTTIDAEVAGDIEVVGEELSLGSGAVVRGNVRWRSRNAADISPDAKIDGEFIEEPLPGVVDELSSGGGYSFPLNLIVAVAVLFLLFPRPLRASANRVATRPGRSLLIGLAALVATPSLAVLFFFTGVGVWLGLALLFTFFVILILGVLTGLFAASDALLRKFREQPDLRQSLAAIFVTVVAVSLLGKIPWVGAILIMAVLLAGIGALCWNSWATLREFTHARPQTS